LLFNDGWAESFPKEGSKGSIEIPKRLMVPAIMLISNRSIQIFV
jgi:hypothetical protein